MPSTVHSYCIVAHTKSKGLRIYLISFTSFWRMGCALMLFFFHKKIWKFQRSYTKYVFDQHEILNSLSHVCPSACLCGVCFAGTLMLAKMKTSTSKLAETLHAGWYWKRDKLVSRRPQWSVKWLQPCFTKQFLDFGDFCSFRNFHIYFTKHSTV